ncbi:MAG: thiamine phosphate synthase [Gemmatimonadetes bacterium]|nr:thiamine phosphate synthase [Gemmatimonadota bacterium]
MTDDAIARLPDLAERARTVAAAGATALHARGPGLEGRACLDLARTLGAAAEGTDSRLFVNDRLDVARIVRAWGLHLPSAGLPVAEARRLLGKRVLIGRSVHSAEAARRAHAEGADYVFLGPIWETASHPGTAALGPETISAAAPATVIAIGGITAERARACRAAGAYGVAAISAVWRASDPGGAARAILLSLEERW